MNPVFKKTCTLFLFSFFCIPSLYAFSTAPTNLAQPVQTVSWVDLGKFQGSWHEIASIPQFFQRNCAKNTIANYSPDGEAGRIKVLNTCVKLNGDVISARGQAKVFDPATNAKLSVTFLNLGTWLYWVPGNYWILDLGPDYRYTVIGDGNREYAWIMSRTPRLAEEDLISAMKTLKRNGYNLCDLNITPQDGGSPQSIKLCDIDSASIK
jgi:apolipoprotein D and lipocalin family protein